MQNNCFRDSQPRWTLLAAAVVVPLATAGSAFAGDGGHVHDLFCGTDHSGGVPGGAHSFQQNTRWTSTATNGGGLQLGDPTTITWSFVPDGASWDEGPSDLISFLDSTIGSGPGGSDLTQRPWFDSFSSSFDRWSSISGLSYVYEPNDDGASANSNAPGSLGVRGDVRIGGGFIDGNSGVLAFNFFPNDGDMTLDTGDFNFYGNTSNNSRRLRNVVQHEHGHGLGMSHVESSDSGFLMEPFIQTSFDGVQLDEIRGVQLFYGDALEKNGGNNTSATATVLGNIQDASAGIGLDAPNGDTGGAPRVFSNQTDFISLGSEADTDFFSFDVDVASELLAILTPRGATYSQGPQNGSQSDTDTTDDVDLILSIFDTDGTTLLASSDATGNGFSETVAGLLLDDAGTYFARIMGVGSNMQFYSLELSSVAIPEPTALALAALGLPLALRRTRRS